MLERLPSLAALVVRHLGAYGDLVAEDLSAAWTALGRRLWVSAVLAVAVLMFVELVCAWVIAVTWNTLDRQWVIGGLAALFFLLACAAGFSLRTLRGSSPGALQLSAQEWEKDRRLLAEFLRPTSEGTL